MGRQRWLSGLVGGFLIFMLLASPTAAVVPLTATISKHATLLEGGQAVWVEVTVTCDPAQGEVLEAFVYVTQAGLESEFAGIPVVCSREPQTFQIRVPASLDGAFTKGKARLSAYVLLEDEAAGDTHSVSPTRKIVIHKR